MMAASWLIYGLSFYLKYPHFDCFWAATGEYIPAGSDDYNSFCAPSHFCRNDDVIARQDPSSSVSLANWIQDFDLLCLSEFEISFFSMAWFIGQLLFSPIIPKLQDRFGRKPVFNACSFVNFLTLLFMLFLPGRRNPSQALLYVLIFVNGMSTVGRVITGYTYFTEFYPEKYQSVVGTTWSVMEGLVVILMVIYFVYISKSWYWIILYAASTNLLFQAIAIWLLPESPKWLNEQKRYVECVRALKRMASFNGEKSLGKIHALLSASAEKAEEQDLGVNAASTRSPGSAAAQAEVKEQSPFQIVLKDGQMLRNLIGMVMLWTSASFGYYLIASQLKYIKGDFYVNNITSQVTEIFANAVSGAVFKFLGLNITITISYCLSLAGMLGLIFSSTTSQAWLSLFILGAKYGIC